MRSITELARMRATLSSVLAWPLLLTLHREADDAGGASTVGSIFELAWLTDISPYRVRPLLDELQAAGALSYTARDDARTFEIAVL